MTEETDTSVLQAIRVILVAPRGLRNVGSVARAMMNFGLSRLELVGGPDLAHPEVRMMAVNAGSILDGARRHDSLEGALAGLTFLVGTTAKRRDRLPVLGPREAARLLVEEARRGQVGLLFGRENHGLDGEELRRAHRVVAIETTEACRALNLSQAVGLLAYEIHAAARISGRKVGTDAGRLVTSEMGLRLKADLLEALEILGIVHAGTRLAHTRSLERLLALGPLQTRDARVLFALARRICQLREELLPLRSSRPETDLPDSS